MKRDLFLTSMERDAAMDTPLRPDISETPLKGVRSNIVQSIRAFRVQTLQDSPDAKATQLLNLIRSKAPLDEIMLYMDHNVSERDRETSPLLAEIYERTHGSKEDNKRTASHPALSNSALDRHPGLPGACRALDHGHER